MAITFTREHQIRAIATCVPERVFDNTSDPTSFSPKEIDGVVKLVGIKTRRLAPATVCSSDLCLVAARQVMAQLAWAPKTIDGLIMVTHSPDYWQPATACVLHKKLGLGDHCAAFDVGLGCSGYAYGLWMAGMMLDNPGFKRVLLLHGETPSRFVDPEDRTVGLLFGDAGSATAIEAGRQESDKKWWFSLHTDGTGNQALIIEGGGFRDRFPADPAKHNLVMNGPAVMNFTLKRVPPLIRDTLSAAGIGPAAVDYFILHQSNRFIMRHLATKCQIPEAKMPLTLWDYGNTGGPSVPLTITEGKLARPSDRALTLLLVTYGVGLSWGSALIELSAETHLSHLILPDRRETA
ncbi:MAG: ketoacyl-ACP synthase III [Verrucomicrobiota bacterium]